MKHFVLFTFMLFGLLSTTTAQCDVDLDSTLRNSIMTRPDAGIYLLSKQMRTDSVETQQHSFILNKGTTYKCFVLSSKKYDGNASVVLTSKDTEHKYKAAKDREIEFYVTPTESGEYVLKVAFEDEKKGCALLALTFIKHQHKKK